MTRPAMVSRTATACLVRSRSISDSRLTSRRRPSSRSDCFTKHERSNRATHDRVTEGGIT